MNDLRRQNSRPQKTFERWTPRTHESPSELARQSEAKRKQAPQNEANECRRRRRRCNLEKASLIDCTGHPIMHRTPNTDKGCVRGTRTQIYFKAWFFTVNNNFIISVPIFWKKSKTAMSPQIDRWLSLISAHDITDYVDIEGTLIKRSRN